MLFLLVRDRPLTSEYDVFIRQILTSKDGPGAVGVVFLIRCVNKWAHNAMERMRSMVNARMSGVRRNVNTMVQ